MKNKKILLAILAVALVFATALIGCSNGTTNKGSTGTAPASGTYTYEDDAGNNYNLVITQARAAYTPKKGDSYVLTITFADGSPTQTSTGTVKAFDSNSGQFTLTSSDNKEFYVLVRDDKVVGIGGDDIPVTLPVGKSVILQGFVNWQYTAEDSNKYYYEVIGVFLISNLENVDAIGIPITTAIRYSQVPTNNTATNVEFKLVKPIDNTWDFGGPFWTGEGDFYVFMIPCIPPHAIIDEAKIFTDGTTSPVKVTISDVPVTLDFSKFKNVN